LSFHSGVDIAAPDGTPVYAVEGGMVTVENAHHIAVTVRYGGLKDSLIFGYWHIRLAVKNKQVVSKHQLLGYVLNGYGHVHFSERLRGKYVDPLRKGGLTPYYDHTKPVILAVYTYDNGKYQNLEKATVKGKVNLVVDAFDTPPMNTPWPLDVLTPSLVKWKIVNSKGKTVVASRTAIDFSKYYTVSLRQVYAPGTIQNGPIQRGVYNLWLVQDLNTAKLAKGAYRLVISASDNRGNKDTKTVGFNILN
jgi:hypothetical protein